MQASSEHDLQIFADTTGQMLARWREEREVDGSWRRRWLSAPFSQRYRKLAHSATTIDERLATLERILNGLKRPTFAFDLFGRLQISNQAAQALAQDEKFALYSTSALAVLVDWCELDETDARDVLRDVMLSRQRFDLPATGLQQRDPHLLHVRGIEVELTDQQQTPELLGVVMELLDIKRLHQSHRWFRELTGQFAQKVRNDLEAVSLAWQRLRSQLPAENRAVSVIDRRVTAAANSMETIQHHVENDLSWDTSHVLPIDPREAVDTAIALVQKHLAKQQLSVDRQLPEFLSLAFARRQELVDWAEATLRLLISDSVSGGALIVTAVEGPSQADGSVSLNFSNQGYGMPNDHVQRVMETTQGSVDASDRLTRFAEHSYLVGRWGAQVEIDSEIGRGFEITIRLRSLELG